MKPARRHLRATSRAVRPAVLVTVLAAACAGGSPAHASLGRPGLDGAVRALCVHDARLIAGGDFTLAGGDTAAHVAAWDDTGWHALGAGLDGTDVGWRCLPDPPPTEPPRVMALLTYLAQLYAGGSFHPADAAAPRALARGDGVTWAAVGSPPTLTEYAVFEGLGGDCFGFPPRVHCLLWYDGLLIVGGRFDFVSGAPACVARWDGSAWLDMGRGLYSSDFESPLPAVNALVAWRGDLIAGGSFTYTGSYVPIGPDLARWTAANGWVSLTPADAPLDGPVSALAEFDDDLIVAGSFQHAGTTPLNHIGRWDGAAWHPLGDGLPSPAHALCVFNGALHADGWRWDGAAWQDVLGANGPVLALTVFRDRLVAGGDFTSALGADCGRIASWPLDLVPVQLTTFAAVRRSGGVQVSWSLGAGAEGCRFTLWRQAADERCPVNDRTYTGAGQFTLLDADAGPGSVRYWLRQEATATGEPSWLGPAVAPPLAISRPRLYPNRPNPFNPLTTLSFEMPAPGPARLDIYDVAGRLVRTLVQGELAAGGHEAVWDGRDASGRSVSSGSYFARLDTESSREVRQLMLAR